MAFASSSKYLLAQHTIDWWLPQSARQSNSTQKKKQKNFRRMFSNVCSSQSSLHMTFNLIFFSNDFAIDFRMFTMRVSVESRFTGFVVVVVQFYDLRKTYIAICAWKLCSCGTAWKWNFCLWVYQIDSDERRHFTLSPFNLLKFTPYIQSIQ